MMQRFLVTFVLVGAFHAAAADASFWVSVGSFQDAAVAERVVAEASRALDETFLVQQADTSNGIVQRVATGPFTSREAAQVVQDHAKAHGYPDSWIFSRQADDATIAESSAGNAASESELSRVLNDDSANVDSGHDLDTMEDDLIKQSSARRQVATQATLQELLKQVKELPTEIPPGYYLNSLYRDSVDTKSAKKH